MTTIGEVTVPVSTWNPSKSSQTTAFDYIDLSAVENASKQIAATTRLSSDEAPSRARQIVAAGDVLVSTVRPNLNAVAVVPPSLDGATASTGFTVLRPSSVLDGRYLFQWVRSNDFISEMVRNATGASYPAVSDRIVKGSILPLPPLDEQRRIAAILDQADALSARRSEALVYLDDLTQALFLEMFGVPMIGTQWPKRRLGDVARIIRGASPRPAGDPRFFGGSIPWLKISDFTAESGPVVRAIKESVTEAGRDRSVLLPPNTLVLTNSATVGIPKIVEPATCIHDGFLAFLDLDKAVDRFWLWAALLVSRSRLVALAPEGTQKNLNGPIVKAVEISVPPLDLQQTFVSRVESVSVAREQARVGAAAQAELFRSLQARAFRGEL